MQQMQLRTNAKSAQEMQFCIKIWFKAILLREVVQSTTGLQKMWIIQVNIWGFSIIFVHYQQQ